MTREEHITAVVNAAMAALQSVPQEMKADVAVLAGGRLELFGSAMQARRQNQPMQQEEP